MSTAAVQEPVQETRTVSVETVTQSPAGTSESRFVDQNPMATLGIFVAVSLGVATVLVGLIAVWLFAIRDSGVMSVRM